MAEAQAICFNSKLVRLKVKFGYETLAQKVGFNSKLVRLKATGT